MSKYFFLFILITGCAGSGHSSQNEKAIRAHPYNEGEYIVYYKYRQLLDNYGSGYKNTKNAVKNTKSTDKKIEIWNNAITMAIPIYLEEKKLLPDKCENEIVVLNNILYESEDGSTTFRCK